MRKTKEVIADKIDGVSQDIRNHFGSIYSDLYNCVEDGDEVKKINDEVNMNISEACLNDVNRVAIETVKKAAAALKPGKGDRVFSFSSDCLKVDSDILAECITNMIQSFLTHSYIPQFMLLSMLVPIIKDKLGSIISQKTIEACASRRSS